jgi:hypothetical protein
LKILLEKNGSLQVNAFPMTAMFGMCSIFLVLAAFLQQRFALAVEKKPIKASECGKCASIFFFGFLMVQP